MSNKDFLSQFSNENKKPASFNEEVRTPVQKEKKPINPWFFIVPAIIVLTAGVILYLIFLRPNIEVVNFVGQEKEAAVAWIRQQGIESNGIVFKEEYNFDNDENVIIDQTPVEGKVNYDAKMTFVLSKGPNPDERVDVPNFEIMTKNEISEWIKTNKLSSTKINTTYSDTVENDGFIKAEYADCEESTFTRSCNLKISISKGPRPAGEVEMPNFVEKKTLEEFELWAATNGIKTEIMYSYSDKYKVNVIMAQSVKEKEIIKVGDTVTIMVSKGKAVIMEDFVGKPKADFEHWLKVVDCDATIQYKDEYSSDYSKGDIISQSLKKGAIIENDLVIVVSLGEPVLEKNLNNIGISEFRAWKEEVNSKGADVHDDFIDVISEDVPVGNIVRMEGATKIAENKYRVPVGTRLIIYVSEGNNIYLGGYPKKEPKYYWDIATKYNEDEIKELCELSKVNYQIKYVEGTQEQIHKVKSVTRKDFGEAGTAITGNEYIKQSEIVYIEIYGSVSTTE